MPYTRCLVTLRFVLKSGFRNSYPEPLDRLGQTGNQATSPGRCKKSTTCPLAEKLQRTAPTQYLSNPNRPAARSPSGNGSQNVPESARQPSITQDCSTRLLDSFGRVGILIFRGGEEPGLGFLQTGNSGENPGRTGRCKLRAILNGIGVNPFSAEDHCPKLGREGLGLAK